MLNRPVRAALPEDRRRELGATQPPTPGAHLPLSRDYVSGGAGLRRRCVLAQCGAGHG